MKNQEIYKEIFNANGIEEKKALLKKYSNSAKTILSSDPEAGNSINEVILNHFYKSEVHNDFNTFKGWQEKGYKIKKGSKSFFIWSKPKNGKTKRQLLKNGKVEEDEKEFKFFGLAYLFSNEQVELINN